MSDVDRLYAQQLRDFIYRYAHDDFEHNTMCSMVDSLERSIALAESTYGGAAAEMAAWEERARRARTFARMGGHCEICPAAFLAKNPGPCNCGLDRALSDDPPK